MASKRNIKNPRIKLLKPDAKHAATKEQKTKRIGILAKIRRGFLKLTQAVSTVTVVIIIVYLTATVFLPTVGGVLSETVGLSGQVHFYNMLQSWGFPMLCITGVTIFGVIILCKYITKVFRNFFQTRIDEGFTDEFN